MGSITNGAYTTTSSNYGTEMKNFVEKMVAISGFTIIEVVTNSTSVYEAYISAFDNTDCLIKVRNSSRSSYAKRYYYDPSGTDTVAGRTYVAGSDEHSISVSLNTGSTTSFIGVQTNNIRMCVIPGSSSSGAYFGFAKMKDMFNGEEIYTVSSGVTYWCCGSGSLGEKKYEYHNYHYSPASHPYVRVYPVQCSITAGQNVINTPDLEFCQIAQGNGWLAQGPGTVLSVNGHKYIQLYSSGIFVRVN